MGFRISSILNFKLQPINSFNRMITHFVSSRSYKGTVESKFVHFSNVTYVTSCDLASLNIYGLFKMVFDCL